ncbi:MAG: hypothetical protein ACRENX_08125 [Candidatus Dormibacteria bacterium]
MSTGVRALRLAPTVPFYALLVALLGTISLLFWVQPAQLAQSDLLYLYLAFVLFATLLIRRVDPRPGLWLGRRALRRGVVGGIALSLLIILVAPLSWLGDSIYLPLGVALLGNVLLGQATSQIAVPLGRELDERQAQVRNQAYRGAYRALAGATLATVAATYLATPETRAWLAASLPTSGLIVFVALLLFLPTMVVAWSEPDGSVPDRTGPDRARWLRRGAHLAVAVAFLAPVAAALSLVWSPVTVSPPQTSQLGQGCVAANRTAEVGQGSAVSVLLSEAVCPARAGRFYRSPPDCGQSEFSAVLAEVTIPTCTLKRVSKSRALIRYRLTARPLILPFLSRRIVVTELVTVGRRKRG